MLEKMEGADLDGYIFSPNGEVDASVIWLHGLGADGSDFIAITEQLGLPKNHKVRFIFPNAPYRAITVNQGMRMRGWYDIYGREILEQEDQVGIQTSQRIIYGLIKQQMELGISGKKIILAGFSQGGAMALYSGLRFMEKLGGIIALSAYQVLAKHFSNEKSEVNHRTPIMMAHGLFDPIVPLHLGKQAFEQLQMLKYEVTWHAYPIQHTLSQEEIDEIGCFLRRCLGY